MQKEEEDEGMKRTESLSRSRSLLEVIFWSFLESDELKMIWEVMIWELK